MHLLDVVVVIFNVKYQRARVNDVNIGPAFKISIMTLAGCEYCVAEEVSGKTR